MIRRFDLNWILVFLLLPGIAASVQTNQFDRPSGYAVASANPYATNAGLEIMREGGNAFDAAVAVSAVLGVVEPYHSTLGGGGFWLLFDAKSKKNIFIDGREVAPKAASRDMFLDADGDVIPGLSLNGALAAAIPGEPAALALIARKYGRLPLSKTLQPAIRLAEEGFVVDHQLRYFLTMGDRAKQLKKFPASSAIFLNRGEPYQVGDRLYQKDLARTLKILARKGHEGFYQGAIAQQLVAAVREAGGIWTLEDLAAYQPKIRAPLQGAFHQMNIVTAPLPSAGGVSLLTMLNVLSDYPLSTFSKLQWVHYLVESMRLAFWQRTEFLGDPDFIQVPLKQLLSEKNASFLRSLIHPNQATPSASLPRKAAIDAHEPHTTHFSILDQEGNRVSATLTINYIFGSSLVAARTGVLLNDEMNDFALKPKAQDVFGLVGSEKNRIEPGKRPLSSMTPTFLETSDRIASLGTPGGSRIPTMVLLAALKFYDHYGAISMVSAMRFHHQYLPDHLVFEPDTFSAVFQKKLEGMGYHLAPLKQYYGDMQAITWDQKNNFITAASDPRHIGMAAKISELNLGGYGLGY